MVGSGWETVDERMGCPTTPEMSSYFPPRPASPLRVYTAEHTGGLGSSDGASLS